MLVQKPHFSASMANLAGIQISKFRFGYEIMCGAMTRIDDVNLEAPSIFEVSGNNYTEIFILKQGPANGPKILTPPNSGFESFHPTQVHPTPSTQHSNFGRKFKFKGGNSNFSNGSMIKSLFVRGKGMIIILLTVNHGQIDHDLITFATDFDPLKAIIRVLPYHFPLKISSKFTQPARGCTPPNVGWGGWVGVV